MSRVTQIILICEGSRDSAFARGFLAASGVDRRCIEPKVNPGGCGHDWVKAQFVEEVANLARFSEGRGVLGLLDEDGQGVAARTREISDRLQARDLAPIAPHEGRCLLVPTRNIETWLYWLIAELRGTPITVDETTDYKVNGRPEGGSEIRYEHCRSAGEHLHTLDHTRLPNGCPPMLSRALVHLREFLQAVRR